MATNCTNCGCSKLKCGCQDTMLTTPAAFPTPVGCLAPEPCSEVLDAQCVIYTGDDILCNTDVVVNQNDSVDTALNEIVDYFCTNGTPGPAGPPGPKGDPGDPGISEYKYIASYFAAGDTFINNTSWHVPANFSAFNYTAGYTGKYKITLTANCKDDDPLSGVNIGLGINSADPIGNSSTNPFIIKIFIGAYHVQTHTYIIDLTVGQIMRLKFKSISPAQIDIDPLYMTIEKVGN